MAEVALEVPWRRVRGAKGIKDPSIGLLLVLVMCLI